MKRKIFRVIASVLSTALLLCMAGCNTASEDAVSVQSVSMITGMGSVGLADRYAGLVVAGSTEEIQVDQSMTISEIHVEVGQDVVAGELLFTYDNEALMLTIEQLKLEIEGLKNSVETYKQQVKDLETERNRVPDSQKFQYTLEIQTLEATIRETEYNIGIKEKELAHQEAMSGETQVKAGITGRVIAINEDGGYDNYGNPLPFMTIMETGNLRIKGTINEMNRDDLVAGMPVIIRSRTDSSVTWDGYVDYVDWENPIQDDSYYYGYTDEMTSASKYPFYIVLTSYDELFMGQHVYIEPGETGEEKQDGVWLPSYFISDIETSPWVWAANSRDKLEKRSLTLGEYDPMTDTYYIESGLEAEDYIAFPDETLEEGMPVSKYDEDMFATDGGGDMGGDIAVGYGVAVGG
ncbi:MAG: efflux RND transporter periplasmic adaptor subunit [Oscillospiraceae bacterium]|nr:efflux RND transporter periplasmic adaptor subunit [Oscillospiraceae bacterium]